MIAKSVGRWMALAGTCPLEAVAARAETYLLLSDIHRSAVNEIAPGIGEDTWGKYISKTCLLFLWHPCPLA